MYPGRILRVSRAQRQSVPDCAPAVSYFHKRHEITDVLDYRFYLAEPQVTLKIHRGPELFDVSIEKGEYDDIGLEFRTFLMDEKRTCRNKCVFCFIDQLPPGMRESLYFKDDDSRMSFMMGNYITLTNLSEKDIDRIILMRTSPLNISVHTTNPELRVKMLNNKRAGNVMEHMRRFASANIKLNCQIVLCKGLNDGAELDRTMADLASLWPAVQSVSVVPAGLTKYREDFIRSSRFPGEKDIIGHHAFPSVWKVLLPILLLPRVLYKGKHLIPPAKIMRLSAA